MKLFVAEDGVLHNAKGEVFGRLAHIEIELIEDARKLTPAEIRNLVECPFCEAAIGELCRRWRGGDRKANHAERIAEALDRQAILSERSERSGTISLSSSVDVGSKETPFGGKESRPTATQLQRQAVQRCWDYWLEISGKRQKLDAKRERILRNAIELVGEDAVKLALLGLTRSPWHNGQNEQRKTYLEIRYALRGRGDESDDERIEKAISWAAQYAPGATEVDPAKVNRWLEDVRYTLSLPHRPERPRAEEAFRRLRAAGFKLVQLDRAPWARIER